ncbi:hypothetical protein JL720_4910 [Aureococcus anophagefferens]|nr:hypothetical protein JL720_4910 [Aureococcus anophagefferens]
MHPSQLSVVALCAGPAGGSCVGARAARGRRAAANTTARVGAARGRRAAATMDDLDMGALDILGAGIVTTNEASKDPEEEARKAEAARHEAASDALSTAIKTEALSKGLATKFKLTHANKDDAGKRVNLLLVDQVTSTSVRLRWTRPKTRYRLDGVRIMMRESYGGQGFGSGAFTTVVEHTREPETRSRVVTSLKSDTEYEFQLAAVHDRAQKKGGAKPMIVDGTRVTSNPIRTTKATYCQAFFFEEPQEIDRLWSVFFGILTRGGEGGANALASGDDYVLAQKLTIAQSDPKPAAPSDDDPHPRPCCLTGRQCLVLNLPGGLDGGCCADIEVKESRRYRVEVFVYHDCSTDREELPHAVPHDSGCALVGFDYKDRYSESKRARMVRQWEKLEVEIIGAPGDRAKIAVQATRSATRIYQGAVLLDACRVFMLGRDEVGDCCSELEKAAGEPRLNETGVLRVTVARRATVNKKASGKERPSKPRLVIKWGAKVVGESEPFDPIEEEKHALSPVGGVTPQAIAVDAARPTWRECDTTRHVLKVKASAKLGGIGVTDNIAGQVAKSMMRDSVLEIEVQDTAVRGVAARAAPQARPTSPGASSARRRASPPRPGTPGTDSEDEHLREQIVDTSKTETQHVDALASNAGLAIAGQQGLLAASRGEQRRGGGRMTMFGRKKPDEDDGGGAPIGRLRLTTRELMCAPPYRAWYRLEDETGLTHMCVALLVRFWDPVPRVPVFSFMARDVAKKEKEAEKERALLSSKTKQFQEEKRKQREIAKSIGALSRKLATECLNPKQRNTYFGKLLFMLGCSAGARVAKAGSSKSKKEVNDGETKKNLQGAIATMTIDRMDPTEAQQRIPVPELLKRKAEMVRQGVLEECVANLCNPRTQESAAALIAAVVTFPVLIVNSSDIHRCSAALQGLVRGLGVLDFIEEACDVYCAEIQGAGASAKDDDNAISDASRAVAPMSVAEKACAAAFEGGRCAPARAPPAATAGALLAVVFGGARTMLVTEMSQRPCLFPVLARAVQENVPCAKKCLENLNFAIQFPPKLVHQYRRFRVLVPYLHDEYWRCPSLEMEMDANEEEMQNACRGARKRARRGAAPPRDGRFPAAARARHGRGSHAFFLEDAARPDLEFVAVAYGEMREGALEDLSAEMDAAVGSPRPGTGAKRSKSPGTPKRGKSPERPNSRHRHTPKRPSRPRSARPRPRSARLLEGGTPADDDEKQEEDVQKKFAAFFHRDSESDANESSDDGGSDSELSMEGAEQKKRAKTPKAPEVEGAGSAGLAAIGLGKAWRRKSMVGRRRSFGMAASARSLGAMKQLRAKIKGDGGDDDEPPPSSEEDGACALERRGLGSAASPQSPPPTRATSSAGPRPPTSP